MEGAFKYTRQSKKFNMSHSHLFLLTSEGVWKTKN